MKMKTKIIWATSDRFKKYHIFAVFYHILSINTIFTYNAGTHLTTYIFRKSWLIYSNPKSKPSDLNYGAMDSFMDGGINV